MNDLRVVRLIFKSLAILLITRSSDSESFQKRIQIFNSAVGPQAIGESVVSKTQGAGGTNLRGSGSSSAWCSAHNGSAAAGRMFEDPEFLRLVQPGALGVWNNNQVGQFKESSVPP